MLETNDLNRFLKELYDKKPDDKDFGGFVEAHKIGQSLGISDIEAEKLAKDLSKAGYIIDMTTKR